MKKRLFSLLLALVLVLSLFPALSQQASAAAVYDLWVGGVQVTSANQNNIPCNSGSARFDSASNTLWLNDAKISSVYDDGSKSYLIYANNMDLTVRGSGRLTGRANSGIQVRGGSLTVDADLTIDCMTDTDHIAAGAFALIASEDVLILGGDLDLRVYSVAVSAKNVTISGGSLTAATENVLRSAIEAIHTFTVTNGVNYIDVTGPEDSRYVGAIKSEDSSFSIGDALAVAVPENAQYGQWIMESDGTTKAKHVVIIPVYDLWVGGVQVNGLNRNDILGDGGSARFDPAESTLWLTDAIISSVYNDVYDDGSRSYLIYADHMDLTVRGSGTLSGRACAGIQVQNGSLAVNADLTIDHLLNDINYWTVGSYGLVSSEDIWILGGNLNVTRVSSTPISARNVTISGGSLTVDTGNSTHAAIEAAGTFTVTNSVDYIDVTSEYGAIRSANSSFSIGDALTVIVPENPQYGQWIMESDGTTKARHVVIDHPYNLWVGSVQVTGMNRDDILSDGGKAKYDPDNQVLTLNNPTITGYHSGSDGASASIFSQMPAVILKGSAVIDGTGQFATVYAGYTPDIFYSCELVLKGDFTITNGDGISVFSIGDVTVTEGNLSCGALRSYEGSVNITGGTVTASQGIEGEFGIFVGSGIRKVDATASFGSALNAPNGMITLGEGLIITVPDPASNHDGRIYATDGVTETEAGHVVIGNPAAFPLEITQQPQSVTGTVGETATFTVAATGMDLTYQWQYKEPGSSAWLNSSFKTPSMTCKLTAARNGRAYRCIVMDSLGGFAISDEALITVKPALAITQQPQDFTGAVGETATFTVKATGEGLSYQWQYKDPGGSAWLNSSFKTATMTCKITAARDGRQYRCIVKDASQNSVTSDAAAIIVKAAGLAITQQPQDFTGAVGETATFTVKVTGDGLTYQWQYKDPGGTWANSSFKAASMSCKLTAARNGRQYRCVVKDASGDSVTSSAGDGLTYQWEYRDVGGAWAKSSFKTPSMTCKITAARDGRQYRCIVTDAQGRTVTSDPAAIIIGTKLAVTAQPQDFTGAVGATASFSVTAVGDDLTYQWQYRDVGGSWANSSFKTATMTCKITAARDGRQYRCIVTDAHQNSVTSASATIHVSK